MGIDGGKARGRRRKRSGSLRRGFTSNEKGEREYKKKMIGYS